MPEVNHQPLEELFRARVITFLVEKGLLPPARAEMLRGKAEFGGASKYSRSLCPCPVSAGGGGGVRFVKTPFQSPRERDVPSAAPDALSRSISITICAATSCPFLAACSRCSSCKSRWNSRARWDS